jgi:CRP/FNR family cyclic AMP-dependent transcriptional regulator
MTAPTVEDLTRIPMFASLTRKELRAVAQLFAVRSYAKDAIVVTEGDRLDRFNIILSGKSQAFWRDLEGHQLKLGVDAAGSHFVDATLGGEPTLVSVIAVEDLRVASIPMSDLKQLLQRHPQVAIVLLLEVVARLRRLLARTKTLTMEDVYGRVVKLLATLAEEGDGRRVGERLTHAEIGQRVGATREMVGRVLRDLARGGYIKADRGRMVILRKPPSRW